jgi:hypothetical protein
MGSHIYLSCICLMLLLSGVGRAQHNVTSATLSGRIEDATKPINNLLPAPTAKAGTDSLTCAPAITI